MNKGETVSNRLLFEKEKIKVGSIQAPSPFIDLSVGA